MDKTELRNSIFGSNEAPRQLVVQYIKLLCEEAKGLAPDEREARGDYRIGKSKFPQTKGEDIASDISSCLAQQNWISWDSEPQLEEVGVITSTLERETDSQQLWQELFEKVDNLK